MEKRGGCGRVGLGADLVFITKMKSTRCVIAYVSFSLFFNSMISREVIDGLAN